MENQGIDRLEIAAHFINTTHCPIFLTGKAGTGKTTFLKKLADLTHKRFVIVAPTGIAALQAKGVTIHSQFLLPLGSFLPTREPEGNFSNSGGFYTQFTLGRRHTLNNARKKVLQSIELLIIDEVSMLRADVLDAIDYRMKSVKRNFSEPFGGVQVLMIGDLFQLPPIVKDQEWSILGQFYKGMHFFEALALRDSGMVYIELEKIFRQKDDKFIEILNHLRENRVTPSDIQTLNTYYKSEEEIKSLKDTITITTHNYKAETHNQQELQALSGKSHFFEANIEKDFPESMYPLPKILELKEGAQIMFIKNDTSGSADYFNGKMATVTSILGDEITVRMTGNGITYTLRREIWENKRYVLNENTKELEEEVIGTFEHYPVKLAWAVTVHKSQGLTFERAIIDVGQAFAPGQVYVALSRLTGLEGLTLRTRIQSHVIASDTNASNFTQSASDQDPLEKLLSFHQRKYLEKLFSGTFSLDETGQSIDAFLKGSESSMEFEDEEMRAAIPSLIELVKSETENTARFQRQLINLLHTGDMDRLMDRLEKGSAYYSNVLEKALSIILLHTAEVSRFSKTKEYLDTLSSIELGLFRKWEEVRRILLLSRAIIDGEAIGKFDQIQHELIAWRLNAAMEAKRAAAENPKFSKSKTGKKRKTEKEPSLKRLKGETYLITFEMSEEGKNISEIATERGMAESTIRGHLARGIEEGKVDIHRHMSQPEIDSLVAILEKHKGEIGEIRQNHPELYDYGSLKMVKSYVNRKKTKKEEAPPF